jgi:hypothetical protein
MGRVARLVGTTVKGSPFCHCTMSGTAPMRRPRSSNRMRPGASAPAAGPVVRSILARASRMALGSADFACSIASLMSQTCA